MILTADRTACLSRQIWAACVLAVALAGTGMLAPRPVLGQSPGSVEGTVVDDAGGAPLAAAVVTLEETGAAAALTERTI